MRLGYVRLLAREFDEMLVFYRDTLDLPLSAPIQQNAYAEFAVGAGTRLSLNRAAILERALPAAARGAGDRFVLVFEAADVDAAVDALRGRGAVLLTDAEDRPLWGVRTAHLRDPAGNLVEIDQRLAER